MGNVIISPNIKKVSDRIDTSGNILNPKTKEIITKVEPEIAQQPAPQSVIASTTSFTPKVEGLSILDQIEQAKKNLAQLEELKRLKIEEKKKELELLQQ